MSILGPRPGRRRWGPPVVAAIATALACSHPPPSAPPTVEPPADAAVAARPTLPAGILARADGSQGVIQVEERDGLRLLTIAGVVHAAVPTAGGAIAVDPIVQLVTTIRPQARTALVIGLGSGKTAGDLAAAGLAVDAVELEPAVIEFARTYFGYRGRATCADGLDYLTAHDQSYDLVLMDAFAGTEPPPRLVTADALATLRRRTSPDGVTVIRGLGRPSDSTMRRIARVLRTPLSEKRRFAFVQVLGSGVADEVQNLYLLSAYRPLDFTGAPPLPMWPVIEPDQLPDFAVTGGETGSDGRRVTLIGYVHVLPDTGELALDLPYWEMGALRYLLTGEATASLRAALPSRFAYPTLGDIGSDGDPTPTLHELLGGGGVKRSDVRLSPLIAQVTGTAQLLAVVHPDSRYVARDRDPNRHTPAAIEPRLPYGGALYRLAVDRVTWSLSRDDWQALEKRLRPLIRRAATRLRRGDLAGAAPDLADYLARLGARIPASLPPRLLIARLAARIDAQGTRGPATTPFARAVACDRVRAAPRPEVVPPDLVTLRAALLSCAESGYRATAARKRNPSAAAAASRLLSLWEAERYAVDDDRKSARIERDIERLRRRYPDLEPLDQPPELEPAKRPTPSDPRRSTP